jgi:hypothetical protein
MVLIRTWIWNVVKGLFWTKSFRMTNIDQWPDLESRQECPDLNSRWQREDPPRVVSASAPAAGPTCPLGTVTEIHYLESKGLASFLTLNRKTAPTSYVLMCTVGTRFRELAKPTTLRFVVVFKTSRGI